MGRQVDNIGEIEVGQNALVPLEVLLVEDEVEIAVVVADRLRERGHRVTVVTHGDVALQHLETGAVDLLIADIRIPGTDGLSLLRRVRDSGSNVGVILMSAFGTIPEAVNVVKNDAAHYLAKPFRLEEMVRAVAEVEARFVARRAETDGTEGQVAGRIIGETREIRALRRFITDIAPADGPVLITGETGTGKELVASTIHALSARRDAPFVAVNCAAFQDTLLEAELFGHERGAFTGAVQRRPGRFRAAHGGTLFLDEVAELSAGAQAKLLRVLEDGSFQALGSDATQTSDVRIVSATNADIHDGLLDRLREDLFYRIKMFHVRLPPLRDRLGDLPLLVAHFLAQQAGGSDRLGFTAAAWAALAGYDYPGNIRELRTIVGHAVALCDGDSIDVTHLPPEVCGEVAAVPQHTDEVRPLAEAEREFERNYLRQALGRTHGNKSRAAELLGISRKTLWKKLRDLDIS